MSQIVALPIERNFVRRPAAFAPAPVQEELPRLEAVLRRRRGDSALDLAAFALLFSGLAVIVAGLL